MEDDRLGLPGKVITCGEGAEPGEESGPCFLPSLILPEPRSRRPPLPPSQARPARPIPGVSREPEHTGLRFWPFGLCTKWHSLTRCLCSETWAGRAPGL